MKVVVCVAEITSQKSSLSKSTNYFLKVLNADLKSIDIIKKLHLFL